VVALRMVQATREEMDNHYPKDEAWMRRLGEKTKSTYDKYGFDMQTAMGTTDLLEIGKMVRGWILDYMTSSPVVKMVVQGVHAIDMVRKLAGHTLPSLAEMGTIRGDYSVDSAASANGEKRAIHNLIHASETPEEAANELSRWFSEDEIHSYKRSEEDLMI